MLRVISLVIGRLLSIKLCRSKDDCPAFCFYLFVFILILDGGVLPV